MWHLILTFLLTSFHVNPGGSDTLAMAWWHIYTVGSKQREMKNDSIVILSQQYTYVLKLYIRLGHNG